MKRIKCLSMVALALGFLMCFGQDALAQNTSKVKTAAEARSNFQVKRAAFKANPHKSRDKVKLEKGKAAHAKKKANSVAKKQVNSDEFKPLRDKNTHQPKGSKQTISKIDREAAKQKREDRRSKVKAKMEAAKDSSRKQAALSKVATLKNKIKLNQN